jgi:two-component system, LytTR family, response regulator
MMTLRALLIDDEISAVNTLSGMLTQYFPQVQILGKAFSVGDAVEQVLRLQPDLIFVDIEMPPFGNAFDILQKTKEVDMGVIFTTAYPHYAVDAINLVQPWAYLVKPFSIQRLQTAIDIALQKVQEKQTLNADGTRNGLLVQDSRKGTRVLRFQDIICCCADGSTVEIYVRLQEQTEKILVYKALRELEEILPEQQFCRTHHGYIVNMAHIKRVERTGRNAVLHLSHNLSAGVSVQRLADFEEKLAAFLK